LDHETQSVHRELGAVSLAEDFHFDHAVCLSGMAVTGRAVVTGPGDEPDGMFLSQNTGPERRKRFRW
jgi:hypothetical protein